MSITTITRIMTAMLNIKLYYKVNSISQLFDLIEPWDFVKTSSMSRTLKKSWTSMVSRTS